MLSVSLSVLSNQSRWAKLDGSFLQYLSCTRISSVAVMLLCPAYMLCATESTQVFNILKKPFLKFRKIVCYTLNEMHYKESWWNSFPIVSYLPTSLNWRPDMQWFVWGIYQHKRSVCIAYRDIKFVTAWLKGNLPRTYLKSIVATHICSEVVASLDLTLLKFWKFQHVHKLLSSLGKLVLELNRVNNWYVEKQFGSAIVLKHSILRNHWQAAPLCTVKMWIEVTLKK